MASPVPDVFLSYKAEDRARLKPLVEALEGEGFAVWWDAQIGGGTNWHEDIEQHLDAAKCVLVAWSKRSVGHDGHFVRDEARRAQRRDAYVPICLDPVDPPLGFGEIQALPLKGWKGDRGDPRFQAVADAVRNHISGEPVQRPHVDASGPMVSRRTAIAGGAVAAAAVAGVGAWQVLRPSPASASIAVLPFANLSGNPAQAYFADGIADEIRSALGRLGGLTVIGSASSQAVRNDDAKTAAKKLDVANILTGNVRQSPSTIRITAELIDGHTGADRWSQDYDRSPGDAIEIQSDIAANVAQALSVALGRAGRAALKIGGTSNPQAQDLLLQATAARDRDVSEKGTLATIALLQRAIDLDPNYAEAYARKSQYVELWASQFSSSAKEKDLGVAQATEAAERAIAIAPRMSLGYGALGGIYQDQLQMKRSLQEFQRADMLPGVEIITLSVYGLVLSQARRQREGLSTIDRAIALDPLDPIAPELKAWALLLGRQYEAAASAARRTLQLEPGRLRATSYLGIAQFMLGRADDALRLFQTMPDDDYRRLVGEAAIAAREGRRQDALKAIPAIGRRYGDSAYYQFAQVYAQAGLIDEAARALETAWVKRDPGLASVQVDPFLDPARKDNRVSAVAAKVFG
jgi:serine/threonine-protein kinase